MLQELKASGQANTFKIDGYRSYTRKRTAGRTKKTSATHGGGIVTLVRDKHPAQVHTFSKWKVTERLDVTVHGIRFVNVYRPSAVGEQKNDIRKDDFDCEDLPTEQVVIAGDLNAHHAQWSKAIPNKTGTKIHDWVGNTDGMQIWNDPQTATRIGKSKTSPDVVIAKGDNNKDETRKWPIKWRVLDNGLSDHLPMEFEIDSTTPPPPKYSNIKRSGKTLWDWNRARWSDYTAELERSADATLKWHNPATAYAKWAGMVRNVARRHIPTHRRRQAKRRWCTGAVRKAMKRRDQKIAQLQKQTTSPTQNDSDSLSCLKQNVATEIRDSKRTIWEARCDKAAGSSHIYHLLRELDGRADKSQQYPLTENGTTITDNTAKANIFGRHYSDVSRKDPTDTEDVVTIPTDVPYHESERAFTMQELNTIVNNLEDNKTPGMDNIHNEMLRHMGPEARKGLLRIMNLSWCSGTLPQEWTTSLLMPIHKPTKPDHLPASYRPIALTSTVSKVLERMIGHRLHQLMEDPDEQFPNLHKAQAGFRKKRSTIDNIALVTQLAKDTVEEGRSAILLKVDLEKAYDRLKRSAILQHLRDFPPTYQKWISAYLSNRRAAATVAGHVSEFYDMEEGVPQGTVLSPLLFNVVMANLAKTLECVDGHVCMYADDLAILCIGNNADEAALSAQKAIEVLERELPPMGLRISTDDDKTNLLAFTTKKDPNNVRDKQFAVHYSNGKRVPTTRLTQYLGILIDDECNMIQHMESVCTKYKQRLSVLYALGGEDWGAEADTMRQVYMTYVLPVLTYGIGVWGHALLKKNRTHLETLHHGAARLITGCLRTTATENLLWEANLRSIAEIAQAEGAKLYERANRIHDSPAYTAVQSTKKHSNTTWLRAATNTVEETKMYTQHTTRSTIALHYPVPPWQWEEVQDKLTLHPTIPGVLRADSKQTKEEALEKTQEALDKLPQYDYSTYTDGSLSDTNIGGAGCVVTDADDNMIHVFGKGAGRRCVAYQAEQTAIREALTDLANRTTTKHARVAILTDSQSSIRALEGGPQKAVEHTLHDIWRAIHTLTRKGVHVDFQYVPSHVGLTGNEAADKEAKRHANAMVPQLEPIAMMTAASQIKRVAAQHTVTPTEDSAYACQHTDAKAKTKTQLRHPQLRPRRLTRKGAREMRLLRTRRHPLLYTDRSHNDTPNCKACGKTNVTAKHLLKQCPKLTDKRANLCSNTSWGTLLTQQPEVVLEYLVSSGLSDDSLSDLLRPAVTN